MATQEYLDGRKKYARPQAMMWSTQPPQIIDGKYIPYGLEVNDNTESVSDDSLKDQFLILSDDNRDSLNFSNQRIESRKRMVNGQMRSYHIADKVNISTSWSMLPSRGFATYPNFNLTTGAPDPALTQQQMVTSDGGAGGVDMLNWYETHTGSFGYTCLTTSIQNLKKTEAGILDLPNTHKQLKCLFPHSAMML